MNLPVGRIVLGPGRAEPILVGSGADRQHGRAVGIPAPEPPPPVCEPRCLFCGETRLVEAIGAGFFCEVCAKTFAWP